MPSPRGAPVCFVKWRSDAGHGARSSLRSRPRAPSPRGMAAGTPNQTSAAASSAPTPATDRPPGGRGRTVLLALARARRLAAVGTQAGQGTQAGHTLSPSPAPSPSPHPGPGPCRLRFLPAGVAGIGQPTHIHQLVGLHRYRPRGQVHRGPGELDGPHRATRPGGVLQ